MDRQGLVDIEVLALIWKGKRDHLPEIKAVMTPFPYWIGSGDSLEKAAKMMKEHDIHHLPVVAEGKPVGVVSQRDLSRAGREHRRVEEVAHLEVCVVDLSTPLDRVLLQMARGHHDAALVVKGDRLVGIFTSTDAFQQFSDCLRAFYPSGSGDEAA